MSTLEIVLLITLIPFTAYNIYMLTLGKKKKRAASQHYRQIFAELDKMTAAEMEKRHLHIDEKRFYLNDAAQGVQLSFIKESRQMSITLKDAFHLMPVTDVRACSILHDELNGKYSNIRAEIKTKDKVITFVFGINARRPKSMLGKMVLDGAAEFCDMVNTFRSPAASETSRKTESA